MAPKTELEERRRSVEPYWWKKKERKNKDQHIGKITLDISFHFDIDIINTPLPKKSCFKDW